MHRPQPQQNQTPVPEREKSGLFEKLDRIVAEHNTANFCFQSARAKVDAYLNSSEPLLNRKKDPLCWWNSRCDQYPRLVLLVKKYLSPIMNSVPCERVFSRMGLVITDRRTNLSPQKAGLTTMISQNLHNINE